MFQTEWVSHRVVGCRTTVYILVLRSADSLITDGRLIMQKHRAMAMYGWNCTYCETLINGLTADVVKLEGRNHLESNHRQELASLFQEKWAGNGCQGDCGNRFHVDDDFMGFNCSNCDHDHFNYFAGQHVWTGIEEIEG